jgi:hypothetical protein
MTEEITWRDSQGRWPDSLHRWDGAQSQSYFDAVLVSLRDDDGVVVGHMTW